MNRKIERVQYNPCSQKVNLQWRTNYTDAVFQNASYDYAVIAVPFSIVKKWRFSTGSKSSPVMVYTPQYSE
jgi:hypothetical protein